MVKTTDKPKFTDFWMRTGGGASMELTRLKSLGALSPTQQLIAALLRFDRDAACELIAQPSALSFDEAVSTAKDELLAGLILNNIVELELASELAALVRPLRELSEQETAGFVKQDEKLTEIMTTLGPLAQRILILKGPVLARQLYSEPNFRCSTDIDILVSAEELPELVQKLLSMGYAADAEPGFCNQVGTGPTQTIGDLLLTPDAELSHGALLTMSRPEYPSVDLKIDAFERGIKMKNMAAVFQSAQPIVWHKVRTMAPCDSHHLLICCDHLAKHRCLSWRWLMDIHLLATEVTKTDGWDEVIETCRLEEISVACWAMLELAREYLKSPVPQPVLESLRPPASFFRQVLAFTVNPVFLWNGTSLPMLLLNACVAGSASRKLKALMRSFSPDRQFLRRYYAKAGSWLSLALVLHWLVIILPGGLIRRTVGRVLWNQEPLELDSGAGVFRAAPADRA